MMLDTTATAIVLVKGWLGQPEIEEWELQEEQRAEEMMVALMMICTSSQ